MTILVKNIAKGHKEGVYIGRGMPGMEDSPLLGWFVSPLANPFTIKACGSRLAALSSYREWLTEKIEVKDHEVCKELARLQSYARKGDLTLLCWCAPFACHGEILKEFLEAMDFSEFLHH